jgi:hypothetical protein
MIDCWTIPTHRQEVIIMKVKSTDPARSAESAFELGQERTEAMLNLQKDLLGAYEEASRAWLARVQSEVDLWTGLAAKLTATRSAPEAVAAYQECVAQRMKMAAEDGQRLVPKEHEQDQPRAVQWVAGRKYLKQSRDLADQLP